MRKFDKALVLESLAGLKDHIMREDVRRFGPQ
jgi:hypothetical protein